MNKLKDEYKKNIIPKIVKDHKITNVHLVPKVDKVVINVGIGKIKDDKKMVNMIKSDVAAITGQKPLECQSKKAISGFKLRQGDVVGISVTLRGKKMYDFIEKLIHVALPRVRDFKGIDEKKFDKQGNLNIGIKEHIIFPEIKYEDVEKIYSIQITIVTNTNDPKLAKALIESFGFPFKKKNTQTKYNK